jgi:UDP-N-acetylmuramoylalanine--D-glutamate ligase
MTKKLTETWKDVVPCHPAESLVHAVNLARSLAKPNQTVLLSPGCSSFDMFKNYEDRGDQFRELVLKLSTTVSPNNNQNQ